MIARSDGFPFAQKPLTRGDCALTYNKKSAVVFLLNLVVCLSSATNFKFRQDCNQDVKRGTFAGLAFKICGSPCHINYLVRNVEPNSTCLFFSFFIRPHCFKHSGRIQQTNLPPENKTTRFRYWIETSVKFKESVITFAYEAENVLRMHARKHGKRP